MPPSEADSWDFLRAYTPARIAPGRAGHSLPTKALLDFNLDHARARDAVYSTLNTSELSEQMRQFHPEVLLLKSQASTRQVYLLRPDWGRVLSGESRELLKARSGVFTELCVVVADGLSASAVNTHVVPVLQNLLPAVQELGWSLAPICLVEQGRVAIADEIGGLLTAELSLILIGERPGLSSPDSLGAYLTYAPRPGLTDERRNCVSNIRPEGLDYQAGAAKILYLLTEMKRRKLSGVDLKDEMSGLLD